MLDEDSKAAEGQPGEDHDAYVDVNVEHWSDSVQDELTQETTQCPDRGLGVVGCEEGCSEACQQIGDTQVGQIDMGRGDSGDAPDEHPQRKRIARERSEEEECVDTGEVEECGSSGAEGENRGEGSVVRRKGVRCILHWICKNT